MSAFSERVMNLTRTSLMVGFATSMSWEVGIFQALAESSTPLTSLQVAQAKRLKERYVRELLGALVTAELVEVSVGDDGVLLYSLDDVAKKDLQGPTGAIMCYPAVVTTLYKPVKECIFADGPNGVRFNDEVQKFYDGMMETNAPKLVSNFVESVPNLKSRLEQGIDVIEMGGGAARLSATFASQFPNSRFVASEVSAKLVESNRARWAHVTNLSFSVDDLCAIPETPEKVYDLVFCNDVIHDLPDPLAALCGIRRLLKKPDGLFMFQDITTSGSPVEDKGNMLVSFYYAASTFLCIPESYQREESHALGPCWGRNMALQLAKQAEFEVRDVPIDPVHAMYICTLPTDD